MNRIMAIATTLIGGALTAGALALAGPGHADADDDAAYLAALRGVPVTPSTGNESDLLTAGHGACTTFAHGFTSDHMVINFSRLTGSDATAYVLIRKAKVYLFPQYLAVP